MVNKISWAITCCNEDKELFLLLSNLTTNILPQDEIIIQADSETVTEEVKKVIEKFTNENTKFVEFPLNKDFASFKNNLKSHCNGDYLVQLDADENIHPWLIKNIHELLNNNPDVDLIWVPRVNVVAGITEDYVKKMRWKLDGYGRVNYPDVQPRIIRNSSSINWKNRVHEQIIGHEVESAFPLEMEEFEIIHMKSFEKQIKQNRFYMEIQP